MDMPYRLDNAVTFGLSEWNGMMNKKKNNVFYDQFGDT